MDLYNKYRPTTFAQVVGNQEMISSLLSFANSPDPPQAYLFAGPTGCGKTTIGRIFASYLGVTKDDFEEKDSADFRGIESIREIRHKAHFKALQGQRRCWLLDECHKLTNDAQNALLKGLEDPPRHAYYILCTTDPDRLIKPLRGRCQSLSVEPLTVDQMIGIMRKVTVAEGGNLSKKLLRMIAIKGSNGTPEEADGGKAICHPRHALQILGSVLVAPPEKYEEVIEKAEQLEDIVQKLVHSMLSHQGWRVALNTLAKISKDDVESVRWGIIEYARKTMGNDRNRDKAADIIDMFREPFFSSGLPGMTLACYKIIRPDQLKEAPKTRPRAVDIAEAAE